MGDLFPTDWLREAIERAAAEVASWPQEKQERMRSAAERKSDAHCLTPSRCNEAQTCVGGCVYARDRGRRG